MDRGMMSDSKSVGNDWERTTIVEMKWGLHAFYPTGAVDAYVQVDISFPKRSTINKRAGFERESDMVHISG